VTTESNDSRSIKVFGQENNNYNSNCDYQEELRQIWLQYHVGVGRQNQSDEHVNYKDCVFREEDY
jgi:hypothetical protein